MPKQHDPIIDDSEEECDRFVVGEISNMDAYKMYKQALASFWVAESCDMASDHIAFNKLKPREQNFLLKVLAFFAGSDGIVLENIVTRFYSETKQAEVRLFYGLQMAMENIHSEVYTELIQAFEKDLEKRKALFRSISNCPAVKAKADWAEKWMLSDAKFAERLVAFAAVEGILFSASFCAIFYFRKRGFNLPGLYQTNEYISRDEGLHCKFAVLLYSQLKKHNKISNNKILEIIKSAVEVERVFVSDALQHPVIGMNKEEMIMYVEYVADGLLFMFGLEKYYGAQNPFQFMNTISMENKSNFFERRVTEYSLADVKISGFEKKETAHVFKLDEEF